MSIYVYRTQTSDGARLLAETLPNGIRWRDRQRAIETKVRTGDRVICWGEFNPRLPATIPALNNKAFTNKFQDAETLRAAGVPTIEVSRTRPQDAVRTVDAGPDPAVAQWNLVEELAEDFLNVEIGQVVPRNTVTQTAINEFLTSLTALRALVNTPAPVEQVIREAAVGWLGRDRNHVGGSDLLNPAAVVPDFFVKKIDDITKEYRVHSFLGKSIRSGIKEARIDDDWTRSGRTPHAWVRSWDGGWRINYDGVSCKQRHRDLAAQAITALGLDFGAVDIGERADGSMIVFEVNRAPGIDGGTIQRYADAINVWINGGWGGAN